MRIISGSFKGRKLASLQGMTTRPTADRVRESIFNIIAPHIDNALVLDLFAGTGALGLEALSRGAASAIFIDSSPSAVKTIQKNIIVCRADTRARVIRWDIFKNLNCLQPEFPAYDLVFMDPPYNKNIIGPTIKNLIERNILKNNATIIIEQSIIDPIPDGLSSIELTDQRTYGKTLVSFLTVVLQKNQSGIH